jgi:hypothetical protein
MEYLYICGCMVWVLVLVVFLSSFSSTYLGLPQILPRGIVHDENVLGLHQLFLDAGRGEEDVVVLFDGEAAACAGHPAMAVELVAEGADVVGGVQWVGGGDESVGGGGGGILLFFWYARHGGLE